MESSPSDSKSKPSETMTVGKAYNKALRKKNISCSLGNSGHQFVLVGWMSPDNGCVSGPFMITREEGVIVEINREGKFLDAYPAEAEGYFPWVNI